MTGYAGRTFAITGGAGAIGAACARQLLEQGARVHLVDLDLERLRATQASLGGDEVSIAVSSLDSPASAVVALQGGGAALDGIVHMAGVFEHDPLDPADDGVWTRAIAANLTSAYDVARVWDRLRHRERVGRLVFCASTAYRRGAVDRVAYSAAKAGVVGLTRALSRQFAPHTLVNAVAPSAILTSMTTEILREKGEALRAGIPLGRFGEAHEVAAVVTFLCGPGASYVTGQTINIDGGTLNA